MSYTPINWQTGDTITAEKLNKMDNGWSVSNTQLFSETVTTVVDPEYPQQGAGAVFAYSQLIDAGTITVAYDGTEYTCHPIESGIYGAPWSDELAAYDFSEFPFRLLTENGHAALNTQTAGEHTISVSAVDLQTSADFDKVRGWGYADTQLFSETVTTSGESWYDGQLTYSQAITADTIAVTYDGTKYTCPSINTNEYGAPWNGDLQTYDFTEFPFNMYAPGDGNSIITTQTAGEHIIAAATLSLQTSTDFKAAVNDAANNLSPLNVVIGTTTWQEVKDALETGRIAAVITGAGVAYVTAIQEFSISCITTDGSNVVVRTFYSADADSPLYSD